ncbi:unnamed protein product [Closterium sp. NIES-53]
MAPATVPIEVDVNSGAARGTTSGGATSWGAEPASVVPGGAEPAGAESRVSEPAGAEPGGAESEGAESGGAKPRAAGAGGSAAGGIGAGGAEATSLGGAIVPAGAGGTGGAGDAGPGGGRTTDTGAARADRVEGAGAGGAGARDPRAGGAGAGGAGAVDPRAGGAGAKGAASGCTGAGGTVQRRPFFVPPPPSSLPPPDLVLHQVLNSPLPSPFIERREPESCPASPVRGACTGRRVPRPRPPHVLGIHVMALHPSSVPLQVPLPPPLESSLPAVPDPDLVAESESDCPPSIRGECALGTDFLDDRQEDFECLAAAVPNLVAVLLPPEGDPDAPDIPTPRSYAEAITVDGTWIFRVKLPPGSPPVFKARYVARGFSPRQGVVFFHTFSPTPKMTTLQVLLHIAAHRCYELHSLEFITAFLQGSLHEEIWLRRQPSFTRSTTLAALGFAPSTADPSLFLRTDTSLLPFYVLVYVDNLVFATVDTEEVALVKLELQKRHICTDLGELRSYLGLQITRDRARRTITLTQSHMVHQVLQRFGFGYSLPQSTPLPTGHSLSAPPSDESRVEEEPQDQHQGQVSSQQTPEEAERQRLRLRNLPDLAPACLVHGPLPSPPVPPIQSLSSSQWTRRSPLSRAVSSEPCRSRYCADGPFHLVLRSRVPHPPVLSQPTESSLTVLHDPLSDYLCASHPVVSRVLFTLVIHPTAPLSSVSALVTTVAGFVSSHRLDYASHLVSGNARSPSTRGVLVFPVEVLEDRQFELGFLSRSQRDYELHSLDFFRGACTSRSGCVARLASLALSLLGPSGSCVDQSTACARLPVSGTTLAALDFFPSSAELALFVRHGSTPFFVLVYVDDLVFAIPDQHTMASVEEKLQSRHTCTDLGELQCYLGLQITRDRAARTITLTQSHMVEQILKRFFFPFSKVQLTPLGVDLGLMAPPSNEPFESSGPYPELVGCLMYLMTCTRPDLAYPLSVLARLVAPGRHRPSH